MLVSVSGCSGPHTLHGSAFPLLDMTISSSGSREFNPTVRAIRDLVSGAVLLALMPKEVAKCRKFAAVATMIPTLRPLSRRANNSYTFGPR